MAWPTTRCGRTVAICGGTREFLAGRGITDPVDVTEGLIEAFLGALRTGDEEHVALGTASAARTIVAVRGLHRFWLREQIVAVDVTAAIKPPRPAARLPKALPLADIEALLDAAGAPGTTLAARDRALLELLYGTGARISEVVGLDVDDLDLEQSTVLLRGKGGKQRIVPLGSYARTSLTDYLSVSASGPGVGHHRHARRCSSTPAADGCPGRAPGPS